MTIVYIILILVQVGVIIYFVRRGRRQKSLQASTATSADVSTYEGLRNLALLITPSQLKLTIPATETFVYGVVMDCNVGDAVVTLSAYITGAVSMCFSSGGGKTGGGMTPEVAETAVDFVTTAQDYLGRAIHVTTTEVPPTGCARFYLLTNHGVFVAQEQLVFLENNSSPWLPLFEKGNEVVNLMHGSGNGVAAH